MTKILVVDDDAHIRELLCFALALAACTREQPELLVLDILMPELDGLEVCRRLRAAPATARLPVLFLSSKDDEVDRIVGLEMGGDDYLPKPFSPRELVARVRALLRRAAPAEAPPQRWQHNRLRLDGDHYRASWDGREIALTLTEFGILRALIARPGKVCRREQLMDQAYELHRIVSHRTIDSHVRRVRAKLAEAGADVIETVHGIGYKLGACT
jgi:two-component system OmpR family response regulator